MGVTASRHVITAASVLMLGRVPSSRGHYFLLLGPIAAAARSRTTFDLLQRNNLAQVRRCRLKERKVIGFEASSELSKNPIWAASGETSNSSVSISAYAPVGSALTAF